METRLQNLQRQLRESEQEFGPDDKFVKQLRSQVQGMERQVRQDYKTEQAVFGATMGNLQDRTTAADPMQPAIDGIEDWLAKNFKADKPTA
jgi:hypothetical protein